MGVRAGRSHGGREVDGGCRSTRTCQPRRRSKEPQARQDAAPAGKGREVDPPPEPRGGQPPRPAVDLRPTPKRQVILRVVTPVSPW